MDIILCGEKDTKSRCRPGHVAVWGQTNKRTKSSNRGKNCLSDADLELANKNAPDIFYYLPGGLSGYYLIFVESVLVVCQLRSCCGASLTFLTQNASRSPPSSSNTHTHNTYTHTYTHTGIASCLRTTGRGGMEASAWRNSLEAVKDGAAQRVRLSLYTHTHTHAPSLFHHH